MLAPPAAVAPSHPTVPPPPPSASAAAILAVGTVLHLFGLPDQPQQLAGPPNATHPIPNPKASLKFAEKLCQTSRDREEELHRESRCWQEVRDGERGAQHELQKILQRHDSTLANVADAANTASVASPFYVAIFMSCWPENGD